MIATSLSSLLHKNSINKPGLCSVYALAKEEVASMPNIKSISMNLSTTAMPIFLEQITLLDGGSGWMDVTTDWGLDAQLVEEEKFTANGKLFSYAVGFAIPNDSHAYRGKINAAYDNREFILVVHQQSTEPNGQHTMRIIGSVARGARYSAKLDTGTNFKGPNKYTCGFTWEVANDRALYARQWTYEDQFVVTLDFRDNPQEWVQLLINEEVFINWGDGSSGFYNGGSTHQYPAGGTIITVQHNNAATYFRMIGSVNYNTMVSAVTGNLPDALAEIDMSDNILAGAPAGNSWTAALIDLNLSGNELDDSAIEATLEVLDAFNTNNGTVALEDQDPDANPLTGDATTAKANLVSRGWTVTN